VHPPRQALTPEQPTLIVAIPGTHGWRGQLTGEWWCDDSDWMDNARLHGFRSLGGTKHPFVWSTDLNGHRFWRHLFGSADWHSDWEAAARALYYYLRPFADDNDTYVPIENRNLVAHSHGLQPVLKACAMGLKINSLVSVMSPVRRDMLYDAERARPNIGRWLALAAHGDHTQRHGSWFDGSLRLDRAHPMADAFDIVPGAGHSKILRDPEWFPLWDTRGWFNWIKGGELSASPELASPGSERW
jgi:hypothetical protein